MSWSEINILLGSFSHISLHEMEEVMLMNRVETKYVFSSKKLPILLSLLSSDYKILDIDKTRSFPYHTTYLDTPDLLFYMQQVRGKLNRHKIRYRRYESSGISFLEIKKKTNQDRTIKWRIENILNSDSPDEKASDFINELLPYPCLGLKPVLINEFNRITLVGIETSERITLDYNLRFANLGDKNSGLPFLSVAEIKRGQHCSYSPFRIMMKEFSIQPTGFSKYCIGSAITNEFLRKNTLKQNLLLLNKIENEYFKSA
jgi:hypothetical protein